MTSVRLDTIPRFRDPQFFKLTVHKKPRLDIRYHMLVS